MTTQAAPKPDVTLDNVYVIASFAVPQPHHPTEISHFEVHVAADPESEHGRCLLTDNASFFKVADECHGKGLRVSVRYHSARRRGERCSVLDAIEVRR